jgi:hypothetical protein
MASKGPIAGGTATARVLNADGSLGATLASATTAVDGTFSIDIGSYSGNVLVTITGGSYVNEATNATVGNTATLRVALTGVTGNTTAQATALTEIAVQVAEAAGGLTAANLLSAYTKVSTLVAGADIVKIAPADVLAVSAASASTEAQTYGLMLAAISQMVANGAAPDVAGALGSIAADLADSTLDATGASIATAITNFGTGPNNRTTASTVNNLHATITAYQTATLPTTTFAQADLTGTWTGMFLYGPSAGSNQNFHYFDARQHIVDGVGTTVSTCIVSSHPCWPAVTSSSSVSASGVIQNTAPSLLTRDQFLSSGKDVIARIDSSPSGVTDPYHAMAIQVKRASGYALADLAGTWRTVGLKVPATGLPASHYGFDVVSWGLDAVGNLTESCIASSDGCSPDEVFSIGIDPVTGLLSLPTVPNEVNEVALSANKDVIANIWKHENQTEYQLHAAVKLAPSYSMADLVGTWTALGFRTPVKDAVNPPVGAMGYDVVTIIVNSDGSATITTLRTSGSDAPETDPPGSFSIASNGAVILAGAPGVSDYAYMNASKNVIVHLAVEVANAEQTLWVWLKK